MYQVLNGDLMEVTTMGELLLGRPKGVRGRLLEVAVQQRFNFLFFSAIFRHFGYITLWILQCLQFQEQKDPPKPRPPSTSEEEREKSAKAKKKKKKKKKKIENDEEPDQKQEASVENGINEDSEGAIILLLLFCPFKLNKFF